MNQQTLYQGLNKNYRIYRVDKQTKLISKSKIILKLINKKQRFKVIYCQPGIFIQTTNKHLVRLLRFKAQTNKQLRKL